MQCSTLTFTRHTIERMFSRSIDVRSIEALIGSSEVIADYLDDKPYPSALLLGFINRDPCTFWLLETIERRTAMS